MSFVDEESDDYYDIQTVAYFVTPLDPADTLNVIQIVTDALQSEFVDKQLLWGISLSAFSLNHIVLQLRYLRRDVDHATLSGDDLDNLAGKRSRFLWHVFAKIDSQYPIGRHNLVPRFRLYIDADE